MRVPALRPAPPSTPDSIPTAFRRSGDGLDYYHGVVIGAGQIGELSMKPETRRAGIECIAQIEPDDYSEYLDEYLATGSARAGENWRYSDIVTVLHAASTLLEPSSYLEIGVRRGRSMAVVSGVVPGCSIIGVDMWLEDYADMDNPGPAHVEAQLAAVGFHGSVELLSGNSHSVLPALFKDRPDLGFDLITVDGDHSPSGARRDLLDVLPRLRIGGALVFDDVRHPAHPHLHDVWHETVASERRYSTWEFDEVGYGVAAAVRRW